MQHCLYFSAFLAFGIGDGISAAYMMERFGVGIEANPFVRDLFVAYGFVGMVIYKIFLTLIMLFLIHIVQCRSPENMYWTINGFLFALTIGGLAAVNANMNALSDKTPIDPSFWIVTFLALVFIMIEIGSFIDKRII